MIRLLGQNVKHIKIERNYCYYYCECLSYLTDLLKTGAQSGSVWLEGEFVTSAKKKIKKINENSIYLCQGVAHFALYAQNRTSSLFLLKKKKIKAILFIFCKSRIYWNLLELFFFGGVKKERNQVNSLHILSKLNFHWNFLN